MPEPENTNATPAPQEPPQQDVAPAAAPQEPPKDEPQAQPVKEEPEQAETPAEAPKEETPEPTEAKEEAPAESEEIDIQDYWNGRYGQNPQTAQAQSLAERLGTLPVDEQGNADPQAVANFLQDELARNKTEATEAARNEAMAMVAESAQQTQLLKKYPELSSDRDLMDIVFNQRDAQALQGKGLSLVQAADKVFGKLRGVREEATKDAKTTTTIKAAAHLDGSGVSQDATKANAQDVRERMASRDESVRKVARQEFLKSYVENLTKQGAWQGRP